AKEVMAEAGVPTAMARVAGNAEEAADALDTFGAPYVVKDDGLAAGKGVVVTDSRDEALAHGAACERVVVEEYLAGPEVSLFVVTDGTAAVPLQPAQDFKRIGDGDAGPNTGGMGAYSPAPVVTPTVHARVMREVIDPTIAGMAADGHPFGGFLYAGLMIDAEGKARVVEFNARLGDPEAQVLLMRLKSDLCDLLIAATEPHGDGVRDLELQWDRRSALGVVMAAGGYPANPRKGDAITGLPAGSEDMQVFHAGTTRRDDGVLVTSGGRVLTVTALGEPLRAAQQRAYAALAPIRFDGMQYRRDIGHRALKAR
ncbi:MAG TPA: phosphoribosylamine--glycine ligase, partial [Burkholderiaceae bacterium]|nr:phosphoribosylamine--glycine ligase [Burkholderiaceae bacterium]